MPSRRDQVQSYQFFVQRMTSALVAREPDPEAAPFRRLGGAGFASVMVAVLCLAAVGVYGLLRPGGATKWKEGGSVILEKETGTRYLYREGRLHPVLNYASALLAMESSAPTVSVSRNSLVGTPRGPRIGIPFAPDALPPADRILGGPWTLCTQPARDAAGGVVATTVLTVGRAPDGGRDAGDAGLLVRDRKTSRLHLVWRDHRYEIRDEETVLTGLTMGAEPVVEVGGAWLNALPAGEPIVARRVTDRGALSTALPNARVGQVFMVESQNRSRQYYLAERARLVPITPVQADVLLADKATETAYPDGAKPVPIELAAGDAAAAPKAAAPDQGRFRAPEQRPEIARLVGNQPAICAAYQPGEDEPTVLLDAQVQPVREPVRSGEQTGDGVPLADRVVIEPGYGVLVTAVSSPDQEAGTLNLVTDLGHRYPLASEAVPAMLGYAEVEPVRLPASLVVRLPAGPALDPATAKLALDPE
ncbi:type VII secretion protein EccB [Micromonospora phaseoli]|uniref:Type VII secretion protein EccB n=1 Tax=Micromonospora phaseoli TaxID=1144548 RepID=A0A1H7DU32_9ACTN|nr:type VII secretion protein EccB [Micromonospora phaseoli]PZV99222.1 type VII secretion protein EccB [Micromonospora phaseoli]GIJ79982.1 type VII secretion protein EccB [Micromonospora phaseoli]SEK05048.1 type VII secretion protein EccB [Micromonospora phaseoli]